MTPTELAAKIAEEVFRTIERERSIIKAQIAETVEKVLLLNGCKATEDDLTLEKCREIVEASLANKVGMLAENVIPGMALARLKYGDPVSVQSWTSIFPPLPGEIV